MYPRGLQTSNYKPLFPQSADRSGSYHTIGLATNPGESSSWVQSRLRPPVAGRNQRYHPSAETASRGRLLPSLIPDEHPKVTGSGTTSAPAFAGLLEAARLAGQRDSATVSGAFAGRRNSPLGGRAAYDGSIPAPKSPQGGPAIESGHRRGLPWVLSRE